MARGVGHLDGTSAHDRLLPGRRRRAVDLSIRAAILERPVGHCARAVPDRRRCRPIRLSGDGVCADARRPAFRGKNRAASWIPAFVEHDPMRTIVGCRLPQPERSAVVGSSRPVCAVCGGPRDPRKREACSDRCRAELSRRRRTDALRARDNEIRALLAAVLRKLEEGRGHGPPAPVLDSLRASG